MRCCCISSAELRRTEDGTAPVAGGGGRDGERRHAGEVQAADRERQPQADLDAAAEPGEIAGPGEGDHRQGRAEPERSVDKGLLEGEQAVGRHRAHTRVVHARNRRRQHQAGRRHLERVVVRPTPDQESDQRPGDRNPDRGCGGKKAVGCLRTRLKRQHRHEVQRPDAAAEHERRRDQPGGNGPALGPGGLGHQGDGREAAEQTDPSRNGNKAEIVLARDTGDDFEHEDRQA
jgi:hypothetical protein